MRTQSSGFSLIELLITMAIIGIVSAVALPAYRSYINTANMSKVNAAYEYAVRFARQSYSKHSTRVTLGLNSDLPYSNRDWQQALGTDTLAPGGGPMFVTYGTPDVDEKGAVMIEAHPESSYVLIYRPEYLELKRLRAKVTIDDVEVAEW